MGLGAAWGLLTGFSFLTALPFLAQVMGLVATGFVVSYLEPRVMLASLTSKPSVLIGFHVLAASVSSILSQAEFISFARYAGLLPALVTMVTLAISGVDSVRKLRIGLTFSGLLFVGYHLFFADFQALIDPFYRISFFLNPNGVAFIASMTCMSLADVYFERRGHFYRISVLVACIACLLLCFLTRSRMALLALAAGLFVLTLYRASKMKTILVALLGLVMLLLALPKGTISNWGVTFSEVYQIDDPHRGIAMATGRTEVWQIALKEIWLPNFFFGVGPGEHSTLTRVMAGSSSAHNGLLLNLCEVGFLGTLPLLVILAICVRNAIRNRHDVTYCFASSFLASGCVESIGETMFFSIGNPGSLLFLLAVATLICGAHPGSSTCKTCAHLAN